MSPKTHEKKNKGQHKKTKPHHLVQLMKILGLQGPGLTENNTVFFFTSPDKWLHLTVRPG